MSDQVERLRQDLERLRASAGTYYQLFEAALDAVFVHDAESGAVVDVNQTMLRMYGVTREEALSASPGAFSKGDPPFSKREADQMWVKVLTEGPQLFDWLARRKDGSTFPVEVGLSTVDLGGNRCVLAVVRDVSRRREAEVALEVRTEFERLVADISTRFVSVSIDDVDAAVETALGDVARFAGVNAGYVMRFSDDHTKFGMTHLWSDGVLSTRKEDVRDLPVAAMPWWTSRLINDQVVAVPSVAALPAEAAVEQGIISSQGVRALIDVPFAFQGEVLGALGFSSVTDHRSWSAAEVSLLRFVGQTIISALERKSAEGALRQSEAQLLQAQKMEAIGRLAGGIAHDFNNLLTGILGYTDLVLTSLDEQSPVHEDVGEIRRAAERAADLTKQLLAFSRTQASNPRVIELGTEIEHSRKLIARIIGEDVELEFEPELPLWRVKVDPGQLDQILVNLATNSRDALPDGGHLRITTRNVAGEGGSSGQGDAVVLQVEDDGIGIPPEVQGKIFEPFFSTKSKDKGTGLGLSTVYGLVRQNGGQVAVESRVGLGTTFSIRFPRQTGPETRRFVEERTDDALGSERILLVEDEDLVRSLTQRLLAGQGYQVVAAGDGPSACETVESGESFDLLLTDVIMPRMKGPELYERLLEKLPQLKCLYMSGYAENLIVHHGVTDPGKRLLQKPFTLRDLAASVRACLDE